MIEIYSEDSTKSMVNALEMKMDCNTTLLRNKGPFRRYDESPARLTLSYGLFWLTDGMGSKYPLALKTCRTTWYDHKVYKPNATMNSAPIQ